MGLFGQTDQEKEDFHIIEHLLRNEQRFQENEMRSLENETRLLKLIEHLFRKLDNPHKVRLALITFINNSKLQIMTLSLTGTQTSQGILGLLDTVTNVPVTATFANVVATPDSGFITATVNADNSITVAGVTPDTGNLVIASDVSYTDSTGAAQTQNLAVAIGVTVAQSQPTADAVALTVTFSTPA